jgi:glycosyltransferase involved in cell wall biosynthesis
VTFNCRGVHAQIYAIRCQCISSKRALIKDFPAGNRPETGRIMAYPPVTVLIPAYNAARTIERALASVWRQNYPGMEVLVVDDGSTDDTGLWVERMAAANLRLIRLDKNRGECGAMNVGIREARTEYIAFLDADDEWLDGKLLKQLPIIEAQPEMSFISCGGEVVDPQGRVVSTFGLQPPADSPGEVWRVLLHKSYVAKPTVVARRAKLLEAGGFNEALKISGDQDMWITLALSGDVGFLTEVLIRVHMTPDSLMHRYGGCEDEFGLPMIRSHLSRLGSRLSRHEVREILGERYARTGRNIYYRGRPARGAMLLLRAMLLGNRPLENLSYLVSAAPPMIRLKRHFRRLNRLQ